MEKLTKLEEQKKKIDAQIRLERKALREKNERKFKDTTLEKEFNKLVTQYENQQQSSN